MMRLFSEICETTQGVQIQKSEQFIEKLPTRERYLYISDLLHDNDIKYIDNNFPNKVVTIKDLVIANTGSPGKVFKGKNGILSNNLFMLKINKELAETSYLFYILSSNTFQTNLNKQLKGGIQKHLGHKTIGIQRIPIPPLPEQKRIAQILDKADALRNKNKQLLAAYDELLQAAFLDMFGDPVTNHKGLEKRRLGEVVIGIVGGFSVGGEQRSLREDELGVLKISAVTSGEFKNKEYKAIHKSKIKKEMINPQKGDLLFSRANTREMVGAVAIVDQDYDYLFLPDKLWRLDLDRKKASQFYLHKLLSNERFKPELSKIATGTSGSMLNISKAKLVELKIPLPSIALQNQFAQIVENVEAQKILLKQSMQESESLFNGLVQKAFKGEL